MSERRCPHCGGLVSAEAEWCGQCLRRLEDPPAARPPDPVEEPAAPPPDQTPAVEDPSPAADEPSATGPVRAGGAEPVWRCPRCDTDNDLELDVCRRCGTSFGELLRADQRPPPPAPPGRTVGLSLLFPGVGHIAAGRTADGVARAVVFGYALVTGLAALLGRGGGGLGPLTSLVSVSLLVAAALYVLTAVDAARLARGEDQLVSSRFLLYGWVGLVIFSVVILVVTGIGAGAR